MNELLKKTVSLIFVFLFWAQITQAQSSKAHYQALFLLKFLKYANWVEPPQYYKIGVIGNSSIIPKLKMMTKNKRINGKPVVFDKISSYKDLGKYSLIYVPKNQNRKFKRIMQTLKGASTLVVTEDDRHIRRGASISFFRKNKSLKFKINQTAIKKNNIRLSRRLLSVALLVL